MNDPLQAAADAVPQLPKPLQALITAVQDADHQLTEATFDKVLRLFDRCRSDGKCLATVQKLAPEYGEPEFLLCVGADGQPGPPDGRLIDRYREAISRHPDIGSWVQLADPPDADAPTLLVARWMCHLAGFRHKTVHLFIDHPTLASHTLVQVRGLDKAESPGCFDLPVAGHVVGLESVVDTLAKELGEELGLEPSALGEIVELGSSESASSPQPAFRNVEYHVVFRGRISAAAWQNVSADAHEVAAIGAFPLPELQRMIERFPDRIASGLKSSLPLYARAGPK